MRILIVTPIFTPDEFPIAHLLLDVAAGLESRGHAVQVVTGSASTQPASASQRVDGRLANISVFRLPVMQPGSPSLLKKFLNYLHFGIMVYRYRNCYAPPDIVYTVVPANENGLAARLISNYFRCPYIINVQDIHPDAIFKSGLLKNRFIRFLLKKQEKYMYGRASGITVIGDSFRDNLIRKSVLSPIKVVPNWVDIEDYISNKEDCLNFRRKVGISDSQFVALYSGTFGRIHGTEVLLEVARILRYDDNIALLFVGKGIGFEALKQRVGEEGLPNVFMLPPVPRHELAVMQGSSDVSLATLLPDLGYTSVPSKVLGYMGAGRPVIALADSDCDTARLIEAASCGFVLPPGDFRALATLLLRLQADKASLQDLGNNGRIYIQQNLSKKDTINSLEKFIREVVGSSKFGR